MNLDTYGTLVAASLVLLLGRQLVLRIAFLRIYSIPEPVVGGLLVALAAWLVNGLADAQVRFDSSLGMPLMLSFFACIGLNADIASLMRGGKPMVRFLFVVVGFLVVQNATGLLLASLQGQPPLLGLLAGSITLSGGHGTGIAWGKIFGASDFPVDGEHGNSRPDRSPFGFSGVRRRSFELACRVLIPQTSTALMRCRIALACNIRRY